MFNEYLWGNQCLPPCRLSPNLVSYHHEVARLVRKFVRFHHRGTYWWAEPLFNKSSNTVLGLTTASTVLRPNSNLCVLLITLIVVYTRWNLTYTTRQGSRVSWLAQPGFATSFGKGVQFISGSPYAETEKLSRLTSPSGILATSWWWVTAWS